MLLWDERKYSFSVCLPIHSDVGSIMYEVTGHQQVISVGRLCPYKGGGGLNIIIQVIRGWGGMIIQVSSTVRWLQDVLAFIKDAQELAQEIIDKVLCVFM